MNALLVGATLAIIVHNTAAVPDAALGAAQVEVVRILAAAGVTVAWTDAADREARFTSQIIIRRQPGGGPGKGSPDAIGTTIGDDHRRGGVSFVFFERVLRVAHSYHQPAELVLAYAIAHEIGHVLLPAPAHTDRGLMKAAWDADDFRRMTVGGELLTAQQCALIRAAIEAYSARD
jgi:hypothetical protein